MVNKFPFLNLFIATIGVAALHPTEDVVSTFNNLLLAHFIRKLFSKMGDNILEISKMKLKGLG